MLGGNNHAHIWSNLKEHFPHRQHVSQETWSTSVSQYPKDWHSLILPCSGLPRTSISTVHTGIWCAHTPISITGMWLSQRYLYEYLMKNCRVKYVGVVQHVCLTMPKDFHSHFSCYQASACLLVEIRPHDTALHLTCWPSHWKSGGFPPRKQAARMHYHCIVFLLSTSWTN